MTVTHRGLCSNCGKWVAMVHPTKRYPSGTRFHRHQAGMRTCWGVPLKIMTVEALKLQRSSTYGREP